MPWRIDTAGEIINNIITYIKASFSVLHHAKFKNSSCMTSLAAAGQRNIQNEIYFRIIILRESSLKCKTIIKRAFIAVDTNISYQATCPLDLPDVIIASLLQETNNDD